MAAPMNTTVMDILKNVMLACEANGLRDLPFVRDARRVIDGDLPVSREAMTKALQPCPHCGTKPSVSENNVPGDWYGHIECDDVTCSVRPSVMFRGPFEEASEFVHEWNVLSSYAVEEPKIDFDWRQLSDRKWVADVAPGWKVEVTQSLGDDTWSFRVNNSGRCFLSSREIAIEQGEVWLRDRVAEKVADARAVFAAFSLVPLVRENVREPLKAYVREARDNIAHMLSKTVRPSAEDLASAMCDDLDRIVGGSVEMPVSDLMKRVASSLDDLPPNETIGYSNGVEWIGLATVEEIRDAASGGNGR